MSERVPSQLTPARAAMAAAAVVALVLSAWLIWRRCQPRTIPIEPLTLCCADCGEVAWDQQVEKLPAECPTCKKPTLTIALQCYKCRRIFPQPRPKRN